MSLNMIGVEIANEIRQSQSQRNGKVFLIVEGDSDARLYKDFLDKSKCEIINAYGKENAIQALNILEKEKIAGILSIVDADFWNISGCPINSNNLLLTDTHDLESMMIFSPAVDKLLNVYGSTQKLAKIKHDIRDDLLHAAKFIGYALMISIRETLNLKFENLPFQVFIDRNSLNINLTKFIETLCNNSSKPRSWCAGLIEKIKKLDEEKLDLQQICCGHDLVKILSIGLCKKYGSVSNRDADSEKIMQALSLAYNENHFRQTKLFKSVEKWESQNSSYKLIKA